MPFEHRPLLRNENPRDYRSVFVCVKNSCGESFLLLRQVTTSDAILCRSSHLLYPETLPRDLLESTHNRRECMVRRDLAHPRGRLAPVERERSRENTTLHEREGGRADARREATSTEEQRLKK